METKEVLPWGIAFLSLFWAVMQFFLTQKHQKRDDLIKLKREAYFTYMKKNNELMLEIRKNDILFDNIKREYSDVLKKYSNGERGTIPEKIEEIIVLLVTYLTNNAETILTNARELNIVLPVFSNGVRKKIKKYMSIAIDYNTDIQEYCEKINYVNNNAVSRLDECNIRREQLVALNEEIVEQMRKEIAI